MTDTELTDLDRRVLAAIEERFPVTQSPYCDVAASLGASEIDVLNSAEKMRETGAISRITVLFFDHSDFLAGGPDEADVALAELVLFDLPWSEHPFAELAAELSLRGIERDEAWVLERVSAWLADGTVVGISAVGS